MAKLFSRLFNTGTGGGAEITEFYSDRVEDKARRKKIRSIEIPQEIRRFTTGDIPFTTDGSFPGIRVRYDASREEGTSGWTIRRFLDIKTQEGERLPPGLKNGEHDNILIGSPACDFDALHELSEESAKRDHLIKQENGLFSTFSSPYKGYGDTPHWRAIAEKANQPVDKHGYVQPVVRGEVLADHVTFNDPKQIAILNSTRPPAIAPAPEPAQQTATVTKKAYNIGDVLPDGWVVGPRSPKTGIVMEIEPVSSALKDFETWYRGESHANELRKKGHTNARMPSANELNAICNEVVKAGRNGNARLKTSDRYWSGTTLHTVGAWTQSLGDGISDAFYKDAPRTRARALRP